MPPNLVKSSGSTKLLQCTLCNKKFSRTDHLKRHQLRHTGVKPYSCIFCSDGFTRSDNLRDHYPGCAQRQNRPIPEAARGGRRSHACDSCTAMKLGCDGKNPCNTCRQKKIECRYVRLQSKGLHVRTDSQEGDTHRGSINFVLNSGRSNFAHCISFPSTTERRNIYPYRAYQNQYPCTEIIDQYSGSDSGSYENDSLNWPTIESSNLINFMNGPFSNFPNEISPTSQIALRNWEQPSVLSSTIIQCVRERSLKICTISQQQSEIDQNLNFIFTPSRIARFVEEAFEKWHPNCPIIHTPSFVIETAPLPLLIVITIMGALYSDSETEVNSARSLLDLIEEYVFSINDLTNNQEIRPMVQAENFLESNTSSLQNLQAAYIMMIIQFWTGSIVSKKRAIEFRFDSVLNVTRRLGLFQARHDQNDLISEHLWIEKESQIRLINVIYHFNCDLSFFSHFPSRMIFTEMEFDLTCEDRLFFSLHPFSEPGFLPSRNLTLIDAFQSLFTPMTVRPEMGTEENPFGLNITDLFTLIHQLFVQVQMHIFFLTPDRLLSSGASMGHVPPISESLHDPTITSLKSALVRWHSLWISVQANLRPEIMPNETLYKNASNYLRITNQMVTNPSDAHIVMHMAVGGESVLNQFRGFTNDDSVHE